MTVNGVAQAVHGFSNFPGSYRVILTGQARAPGDSVAAVFDNLSVRGTIVENFSPTFSADQFVLPTVVEGQAVSEDISVFASDPESDPLTFSKAGGSAWLSVDGNGLVTGAPAAGDVGLASIAINVRDDNGNVDSATFVFRVEPAVEPDPVLFGWWPLNEGSGGVVGDLSGNGNTGTIANVTTGGLSPDGSAWTEDPTCGTVLSFNGENFDAANPGSWVALADPLPSLDSGADFSWSLWAKPDQGVNNDIIVGNRYMSVTDGVGTDFTPREFVKFTSDRFEFDANGGAGFNYADLVAGEWVHLVIVKQGNALFFYRDGAGMGGAQIAQSLANPQPIFFGGQGGLEVWRGCLSDVRMFESALSENQVSALFAGKGSFSDDTLRITSITRDAASGAVTIEWNGTPGSFYYVEGKRSLTDPEWIELEVSISSPYTLMPGGILDPAVEDQLFLRVGEQN
ncbi:hypothetical protein BH23VER1_BH23VER1_09950 [soil metagenome]